MSTSLSKNAIALDFLIKTDCRLLHVTHSVYHKCVSVKLSHRAEEDEHLADKIEKSHEGSLDKRFRRLNVDLRCDHDVYVNNKSVRGICRVRDIRSTVKYSRQLHQIDQEFSVYCRGLLNRQFYATRPNEKWLSDVAEFKWYEGFKHISLI